MDVLFDYQIFCSQYIGGISRYFYELLKHLPDEKVKVKFPLAFSNNYYLKKRDVSSHFALLPHLNLKIRNKTMQSINEYCVNRVLKSQQFDLFHPTYYQTYYLDNSLLKSKPLVLTVHDMTHERFMKGDEIILAKKKLMQRADRIIAISQHTKKDILKYINVPEERISVVYHGQDSTVTHNISRPRNIPDTDYILYVGSRNGYKNFEILARAFSQLVEKNRFLNLICTGEAFTKDEYALFDQLKIKEFVYAQMVTDEELRWLYKNALLFVFPSLYEGFGFPILEAFSMGCPVVLSNASCFPEIAGNAAAYFDPMDVDSIVQSIESVVEDEEKRKVLVQLGTERLSLFTWNNTARETANVYKALI
ncbi:glycosyltransferase family 1 protein [Parabacteroides sp. Marseille-P3160]|uniref:glycosyltransferase family 4 protein n=1 Tax=Parabacteroides sp. Marseille-P3160 TaxID=1917887 RepID=UPI0009BBDBA9|nr:glycosyltransferase family 1 protein [Parabacteroides sp. Marseille-P3160]